MASTMPPGYKPSPLGYGSPRSSQFRRPESPASPSPLRQSTPSVSPTKGGVAGTSGSGMTMGAPGGPRFASATPSTSSMDTPTVESRTPRGAPPPPSPAKVLGHGSAISQLQPAQVRTLREAFQILDRDSDGVVGRDDVADMLSQLGLPSNGAEVSQFFPPPGGQTITLAAFLNSIASALAQLSAASELLSAFSAFDDDDNGQVDLAELREAVLNTATEPGVHRLSEADVAKIMSDFTARREFTRSMTGKLPGKKGDVFKYRDFVGSITGGNGTSEAPEEPVDREG